MKHIKLFNENWFAGPSEGPYKNEPRKEDDGLVEKIFNNIKNHQNDIQLISYGKTYDKLITFIFDDDTYELRQWGGGSTEFPQLFGYKLKINDHEMDCGRNILSNFYDTILSIIIKNAEKEKNKNLDDKWNNLKNKYKV